MSSAHRKSQAEVERIRQALTGRNNREAADIIGFSKDAAAWWRKKLGIPNPHDQSKVARKYAADFRYFQTIDTEEKAYILGFIAADGNVNPDKYSTELRIVVHPKDVDILEKITEAMKSTYPIYDHKLGERSGYPGSNREQKKFSIKAPGTEMRQDLARLGIFPNKTLVLRYPDIPPELDRHFIRGFIEGDGWVSKGHFGVTSNHYMIADLQRRIIQHGFQPLQCLKVKEHSSRLRGQPRDHLLIKWLYEGATIYLNRKFAEFTAHWRDYEYKPRNRDFGPIRTGLEELSLAA